MEFQNKLFEAFQIKDNEIEYLQKEFYLQSIFRIKSEQKNLEYYQGIQPSFYKKNRNIIQKNEEKIKANDFNSVLIEKNFVECLNEKFFFNRMSNKRIFTDKQKLSQKLIKSNQDYHNIYYYQGGLLATIIGLSMIKRYRQISLTLLLPQVIAFSFCFNYLQSTSKIDQYFYSIPKLPEEDWESEKMDIYSQCLHYSKEPLLKLLNNQS